ncbi:MAG TPA: tRNA epoxyqueuosine(34) reductase QueG [Vicinamibacterales bacterium]|nr:tRNA epoxyqueuosine(34) reductase QueG [Vicinamibacterales bacterium]
MTSSAIKAKASEIGFDLCGIAPAADLPELQFLREWLDRGYGGTMTYLHRSARKRADVRCVIPSAQTVIVTGTLYNTDRPYSTEIADRRRAGIARYAWGDDYHEVIGGRMEALLAWMREQSSTPFEARAYVDTGPVQERVYAQHAGIGWIGKNSCVINPRIGSWIFLSALICSLPLDVDPPSLDQCGACTLCIEACPTQAIVAPGVLDATRCISYLTIELKSDIPKEHRRGVGSHVYGCDICQEVCPWNATAARSVDPAWQPRAAWDRVDLLTLARRTDDDFTAALRGSPMRRAGVRGLRRNLAVALDNGRETAGEDLADAPS